ncbi:MAG TPA: methyltransferase, FxLD system [Actinoplanes sp.]
MNPDTRWYQIVVNCTDWQAAGDLATTRLQSLLTDAVDTGAITGWWYVRKGPLWRLRLQTGTGQESTPHVLLHQIAAMLAAEAPVVAFGDGLYEPETYRFGGEAGMDAAHELFIADSRHTLQYLAITNGPHHRREIAVRLATRLMTAAGLDFYEQGDVWRQITDHRGGEGADPAPATTAAVHQLLTAAGESPTSPLTTTPAWPAAFDTAGRTLAELAHHGDLTRGLRAVLTDHLLFHFNRIGISAADQRLLATAAARVVFHRDTTTDTTHGPPHADDAATVDAVTSDTTTAASTDHADLRRQLVQHIDRLGTFRTPQVKAAFDTVPRHLFLPDIEPTDAYGPHGAVVTKRTANGTAISSASSPNLVAAMLEQLSPQPGHRVLEIGAATGINAALLAELVGPTGTVVTIELDKDLADGARAHLTAAGYPQVAVVCGDGALGYTAAAPYDRIEVTAGAWDISTAWWDQLPVGGRIVVPLRLHGSGLTRSLAFDRVAPGMMVSTSAAVCGFVPMRGATEHGERHIRLAEDVVLKVDAEDLPDEDRLARALTQPGHERWTGIGVRHDEPAQHLDLWLATHSDASFGRIAAGKVARSIGLVNPAVRWAGATLYERTSFSYLTTRPHDDHTDELGIVTHGTNSAKLANQLNDLLHLWHTTRPAHPHITAYATDHALDATAPGLRIHRPANTLAITW